jgi:hypothetical protein
MNDFEVNPMRTGLMFVPLGRPSYPDFPGGSRGRGHLAELEAEIEAVMDPGAEAETKPLQPSVFRRLLDYFQWLAPQSQPLRPTGLFSDAPISR